MLPQLKLSSGHHQVTMNFFASYIDLPSLVYPFFMTMSKNGCIEKDDNDKDKQYQKREDRIFSFFRKLRKIEI